MATKPPTSELLPMFRDYLFDLLALWEKETSTYFKSSPKYNMGVRMEKQVFHLLQDDYIIYIWGFP